MKLFVFLTLAVLGLPAFSQTCYVDMVDGYNRVVRTFSSYGEQNSCIEGMKECRKTIRLQPQLGGVDCIRATDTNPNPYPNPGGIPGEVARMTELDQAINYALEGCHVVPRVSGWANQLYVRGQFLGNFEVGRQDIELRRAIRDYQARGQCLLKQSRTLQIQFRPSLIQEAINFELARNCHVLPRVSGWANQLMINGQFSGNFDVNNQSEQARLKSELADNIVSGRCQQRSYEEIRLLQDPYLIQDFANFQYRGCHVKLNVSGWANQLYVGNQFAGNFDRNTEVKKLQSALVDLVIRGTCRLDRM
jgi:hypothetical protein